VQPSATPPGGGVGAGGTRPGVRLPDTGTGAAAGSQGYPQWMWLALAVSASLALAGGMMLTVPNRRR
jgi:hypothetical protein